MSSDTRFLGDAASRKVWRWWAPPSLSLLDLESQGIRFAVQVDIGFDMDFGHSSAEHQRGTHSFPSMSMLCSERMAALLSLFDYGNSGFESRKVSALPHSRDLVPFLQVWAGLLSWTKTILQRPLGYISQRFPGATWRGDGTDGSQLILVLAVLWVNASRHVAVPQLSFIKQTCFFIEQRGEPGFIHLSFTPWCFLSWGKLQR